MPRQLLRPNGVSVRICAVVLAIFCVLQAGYAFVNVRAIESALPSVEQNQIAELEKQLEFMVWERERALLAEQLEPLLQRQINAAPFDAHAWRKLSYAQALIDTPLVERVWTLHRATTLSRWNKVERTLLAHHCLVEFDQFNAVAPALCKELIDHLPAWHNLYSLARKIGVPQARLALILEQIGKPYSEFNK